jgi:hypothetical protein
MLTSLDGVWMHDQVKPTNWRGESAESSELIEFIEAKEDGWRITFFMQERPLGLTVFGRKREAKHELSHLLERRPFYKKLECSMSPGDSVDGELYVPGRPASDVISAMKDQSLPLTFSAFAVPCRGYEPFRGHMGDARHLLDSTWGVDTVPQLPFFGQYDRVEMLELAHGWGAEGVVLKEQHLSGWYKVKLEHTVDLVVTDVKPGKELSKYEGQCGSLGGGVYASDGTLRRVAYCSGMDDAARSAITGADAGRVFECAYQYVGAGGRLRHPRFLRWRDDKPAIECIAAQLEQR